MIMKVTKCTLYTCMVLATLAVGVSRAHAQVAHDSTLKGDGTQASPLGVKVPLALNGSAGGSIVSGTNTLSTGVYGGSTNGTGVYGYSDNYAGVQGEGPNGIGVRGFSTSGKGVFGESTSGYGVQATSGSGIGVYGGGQTGVYGESGLANGDGVVGICNSGRAAHGVYGQSTSGWAGYFSGKVHVTGMLSKGGGSFKIDHPLDPANKYLSHSFVESPDMMNIYNGNIALDANGEAVVELPEWFETLNRDFRYHLTCIGGFAPVYIAEKVANNRFKIAGGTARMEVSWQVTGIRQDAWANAHRVRVEEEKAEKERGHYLHPELFGQPEEKSVEWAQRPELMQRTRSAASNTPPSTLP
jgi:hypothetical protein